MPKKTKMEDKKRVRRGRIAKQLVTSHVTPAVLDDNASSESDRKTESPRGSELSHQFDEDTARVLREVVGWWKQKGQTMIDRMDAETVPKFKEYTAEESQIISVRIPKTMLAAVKSKIREGGAKTGGSFSRLCMWLLWKYIGEPEEYLETSGVPKS